MAKNVKTYEEALKAQEEAKAAVKEAKTTLTEYYTKNKLKRNEDYTDDEKHGAKILRLQNNIDKASDTLANINEQVKELKPSKGKVGRDTKYDYPEDCVTSEQRKKYRIQQRKEAESDKPKKEKKTTKVEGVQEQEKTSKKETSRKKDVTEDKKPVKKTKKVFRIKTQSDD